MQQKPINRIYSYWGVLGNIVIAWFVLLIVVLFAISSMGSDMSYDSGQSGNSWIANQSLNIFMMIFGLITLCFFYAIYRKKQQIASRTSRLTVIAKKHHYAFAVAAKNAIRSKNFMLIPQHDAKVSNCMSTDDWIYGELSYNIYRRTKYGDYVSETVYYSLLQVPLPRKLPNMFFDGFKAHGQQFHWLIDSEQITTLEGNFDKYFITYFPEQYHIDARSIISPEVMQAMIDIYPADIEIIGDNLYIYSPLLPTDSVVDFTKNAIRIRDVMMDHSQYYVDMLSDTKDRSAVSVYGAELNKRNGFPWLTLALGLYFVPMSVSLYTKESHNQGSWISAALMLSLWFAMVLFEIIHWYRTRQKLHRKRERLYRKVNALRAKDMR